MFDIPSSSVAVGATGSGRRRPIAERRVRSSGVVVNAPVFNDHRGLLQAIEYLTVQAFVAELRSVVPTPLRAAAIHLPCPCKTSICRSFVTICSAPNLFLGIILLPPRLILTHRLVQKTPGRSHF